MKLRAAAVIHNFFQNMERDADYLNANNRVDYILKRVTDLEEKNKEMQEMLSRLIRENQDLKQKTASDCISPISRKMKVFTKEKLQSFLGENLDTQAQRIIGVKANGTCGKAYMDLWEMR